eukprot:gene21516-biopygen20670
MGVSVAMGVLRGQGRLGTVNALQAACKRAQILVAAACKTIHRFASCCNKDLCMFASCLKCIPGGSLGFPTNPAILSV